MLPKISIVTATLNVERTVPGLIESIQHQTDQDFEWIVVDGESRDRTLELLRGAGLAQLRLISEPDFGIYDALNKALRIASGDYYLVCGADDRLSADAVEQYRRIAANTCAEIISARVETSQGVCLPGRGRAWLRGHLAYVSQHAVGSLIKRSLHESIGFYSNRFKIAADQLFIKRVCMRADHRLVCGEFVAGLYATNGVSGQDVAASMTEFFRVQLETEPNKTLQVFLFLLRLLRHWRKVVTFANGRGLA